MTLSIAQEQEYLGNDFWTWRAWIAGEPTELDQLAEVKWLLHPSFSPSVVVKRDRGTSFLLERKGWGTFTLRAELRGPGGDRLDTLRAQLKLYYPDGVNATEKGPARAPEKSPQPPEKDRPNIFLSYASSDRSAAMSVRQALESMGVTVVDGIEAGSNLPEFATLDLLGRADGMVAYLSSDLPSAFVAQEINASVRSGKPTVVLTNQDLKPIAGVPSDLHVVRIDPLNATDIADAVTSITKA